MSIDVDIKEQFMNTMKIASNTIGTHILTLKIYEHDGNKEAAAKQRDFISTLENQLEKMVKLYREMHTEVTK